MRVPVAWLAIPLLAGSVAGILLVDRAPAFLIFAAAGASVLALVSAWGFFLEGVTGGVLIAVIAGGALAGYSSGASTASHLYAPSVLAWHDEQQGDADPATLDGTVLEDGASGTAGTLLTVGAHRICAAGQCVAVRGGVRLSVSGTPLPADVQQWRAGRSVRVPVTLRRPGVFANPGLPDDTRALARRGVALLGAVKSSALVEVTAPGTIVQEAAGRVRAWVRERLAALVGPIDERSAAVATAILIGDRTGLSDEDERRLQDAGTYHVIAISGGNIAILTALLIGAARALRVPYRTAASVTIAILLFYGEVAGGAASVGRAITAAVIFLFAVILDHRAGPLNVLGAAALLAAGLTPVSVLDAGFLLSFGATAGIILGAPALVPPPPRDARRVAQLTRRLLRAAVTVLAATLCAEAALMPIAASLFSRVTLAGLVLNFAAIPLMTVVQCGSLLLLGLSGSGPPLTVWLATAVHRAADWLVESAHLVDFAPWVARDVPAPAWGLVAVYYAAAGVALGSARFRRPAVVVLCASAGAVFAGTAALSRGLVERPSTGVLRVVTLDVGQGDATVAILPDGRALLTDAGGLAGTRFDIGGRVVVPSLRALRVSTLHALILTHGDPDHITGAEVVIERLRPQQVWEGVAVPPHPVLRTLADLAKGKGIPWRTVRPGDVDRFGDVAVRVHHPPEPDWERQRVRNDDSIVVELRYGDVSILLPGDVGSGVEAALIERLDLAPTVILKAAHHGSATSSSEAFIEATHPAAVIFSAGRNNRFNHPAPVVVERFRRRGIPVFNTATDGAVFVETDGKSAEVRGWRTRKTFIARATHDGATTRRHDGQD